MTPSFHDSVVMSVIELIFPDLSYYFGSNVMMTAISKTRSICCKKPQLFYDTVINTFSFNAVLKLPVCLDDPHSSALFYMLNSFGISSEVCRRDGLVSS